MPLKERLSDLFFTVLSTVLPPRQTAERVRKLTPEALHEIVRREKDPAYAPEIRSILPYRNPAVKALIYEMKYRQNERAFELAAEILKEELMGAAEESIGTPILIPVPMHTTRRRERGYNQTELLCEKIVAEDAISADYRPHALTRTVAGVPQQKLARKARLSNMKNSMRADASVVKNRICIVLDDVSTTGATLMECKRALKAAGAKNIFLLALAG